LLTLRRALLRLGLRLLTLRRALLRLLLATCGWQLAGTRQLALRDSRRNGRGKKQ